MANLDFRRRPCKKPNTRARSVSNGRLSPLARLPRFRDFLPLGASRGGWVLVDSLPAARRGLWLACFRSAAISAGFRIGVAGFIARLLWRRSVAGCAISAVCAGMMRAHLMSAGKSALGSAAQRFKPDSPLRPRRRQPGRWSMRRNWQPPRSLASLGCSGLPPRHRRCLPG